MFENDLFKASCCPSWIHPWIIVQHFCFSYCEYDRFCMKIFVNIRDWLCVFVSGFCFQFLFFIYWTSDIVEMNEHDYFSICSAGVWISPRYQVWTQGGTTIREFWCRLILLCRAIRTHILHSFTLITYGTKTWMMPVKLKRFSFPARAICIPYNSTSCI